MIAFTILGYIVFLMFMYQLGYNLVPAIYSVIGLWNVETVCYKLGVDIRSVQAAIQVWEKT